VPPTGVGQSGRSIVIASRVTLASCNGCNVAIARPTTRLPRQLGASSRRVLRGFACASPNDGTNVGLLDGTKRRRRLKEAGVNTQAEIVSALQVGQMQDARPIFNVALRITPADGGEPFEATWTTQTDYEPAVPSRCVATPRITATLSLADVDSGRAAAVRRAAPKIV